MRAIDLSLNSPIHDVSLIGLIREEGCSNLLKNLFSREFGSNRILGVSCFVRAFAGLDASTLLFSLITDESFHTRGRKNALKEDGEDSNNPEGKFVGMEEYLELCRLVEKVIPRMKSFAPWYYYVKVAITFYRWLSLLNITCIRMFFYHPLLCGSLGYIFAVIGLNIQHDANHGAISRRPLVNRILGMSQNWIGGSAINWIHQHVVQHHIHTNDIDQDPDMDGGILIRINANNSIDEISHCSNTFYFSFFCHFNGFSVGLNYQIEHHLFPRISHCHYPKIAPVVRHFCEERNIPYVHFPSVLDNINSAIKHLVFMGGNAEPFPELNTHILASKLQS
ncbi:unnamed protein product [Lepeophtheirus salmonis]|uniref:(salmon louse) hypothetical protein n=1 Tax=Lepeophtheirus salmonis TaxID=72036 RepID=A0A7R8H565_LEPSM|nr:unnamed protein product [Lepeophtheirus salmonis]CAF2862219.1 unnamed protein product [Lepeophtheirus salmonis]